MTRLRGGLVTVALIPLAALLVQAVNELPDEPGGLTREVAGRLPMLPVSHPVTAVLLDFRAYDTWLEVMVLLLAVSAALVVRRTRDLTDVHVRVIAPPLLHWAARLVIPLMLVVAGYMLWLGTHAPGGAFQAGAVVAAAGVLALHAGALAPQALARPLLPLLLVAGAVAFLVAAAVPLLADGTLLRVRAGWVILLVESLLAISVGTTLTALFIAARPVPREAPTAVPGGTGPGVAGARPAARRNGEEVS